MIYWIKLTTILAYPVENYIKNRALSEVQDLKKVLHFSNLLAGLQLNNIKKLEEKRKHFSLLPPKSTQRPVKARTIALPNSWQDAATRR